MAPLLGAGEGVVGERDTGRKGEGEVAESGETLCMAVGDLGTAHVP